MALRLSANKEQGSSMKHKVDFLGLSFDRVTMDQAVARIEEFIREGTPHKIFCPNVALLIRSRKNEQLRRIYETCDLLPADGMGIYYASRLLGDPVPEMVSAVILFFRLVERAAEKGYRLYLFGTKQEILENAVDNLKRQYPTLNIVGCRNGYFTPDDEPQIVQQIARARPDILFVGMSSPLKERFVEQNLERMGVPVCLGVGGTFDVAAGVYKLAPVWMRKLALEWVYRLIQEPRRMWKRYLTTTSIFLCLVFKAFLSRRLFARLRPAKGISGAPVTGKPLEAREQYDSDSPSKDSLEMSATDGSLLQVRRTLMEDTQLRQRRFSNFQLRLKRLLDIGVSATSLIILSPLFTLIALAIKLTSPGPVLYRWRVIGRDGRPFVGYKFRTMVPNADRLKERLLDKSEMTGPVFKIKSDPRVTPVGRILRKFSLDELPQLWSVLKGDMSLVGPRPVGPHEWEHFEDWQRPKLSVTPGMICLWHIRGKPKEFNEWIKLDLEYIDSWSIWLDIKLLFGAAWYVLSGRNY